MYFLVIASSKLLDVATSQVRRSNDVAFCVTMTLNFKVISEKAGVCNLCTIDCSLVKF